MLLHEMVLHGIEAGELFGTARARIPESEVLLVDVSS